MAKDPLRSLQDPAESPEVLLDRIQKRVSEDMELLNRGVEQYLYSEVPLIRQLSHYIIGSGGKRLRPMLLLLGSRLFGYQGEQHIRLASIIEFIHTATLLHDDVVDASRLRRGQTTANQRWGNEASVLVGDFLSSRAFQMVVELDSIPAMRVLASTTNIIAEGEVQQLSNQHNVDLDEQSYLHIIGHKTARLFEAAGRLSAILCERSSAEAQAMAGYGLHLGIAYQLIDDCLDYNSSAAATGKNLYDDLAEGKPTLPLLYALWHGSAEQAELIRNAIRQGGLTKVQEIMEAVASSGGTAYTADLARREVECALDFLYRLPYSPYRDTLHDLAIFAVTRKY